MAWIFAVSSSVMPGTFAATFPSAVTIFAPTRAISGLATHFGWQDPRPDDLGLH